MRIDRDLLRPGRRPAAERERASGPALPLLWAYPPLLAACEMVTVAVGAQAGLVAYGLVLLLLAAHRALSRREAEQQLALALLPLPLMRVLALGLPLGQFPQALWPGLVAAPLLASAWLAARRLGLSRRELGLAPGYLPLQLMIAAGGPALGAAAYAALRPEALAGGLGPAPVALLALAGVLCAGIAEELIFRGLLQATALRFLGRWALLYGALSFAMLQVGHRSPWYLLLALGAGLALAYAARATGSLLGVGLAHGLASLTLLVWMPAIASSPDMPAARIAPWAIALGGLLALGALVHLSLRGRLALAEAPARGPEPAGPRRPALALRALRQGAGLTYVGLARRCGHQARVLAEFELGLRPLSPEQLSQIAATVPPARH